MQALLDVFIRKPIINANLGAHLSSAMPRFRDAAREGQFPLALDGGGRC